MFKHKAWKTMGLVALLGTGVAWAHDQHTTIIYKGDDSARAVCVSIARDDVNGLRTAFRHGRDQRMERSHLTYECNSMQLDEFALTMNADDVSEYLAPMFGRKGVVRIEQVGSISE